MLAVRFEQGLFLAYFDFVPAVEIYPVLPVEQEHPAQGGSSRRLLQIERQVEQCGLAGAVVVRIRQPGIEINAQDSAQVEQFPVELVIQTVQRNAPQEPARQIEQQQNEDHQYHAGLKRGVGMPFQILTSLPERIIGSR